MRTEEVVQRSANIDAFNMHIAHKQKALVCSLNQTVKQYMVGVQCVVISSRAACRKFRLFIGITTECYYKVFINSSLFKVCLWNNSNIVQFERIQCIGRFLLEHPVYRWSKNAMNHWSWTQLICKCNFKNANCKCKHTHTHIHLKWLMVLLPQSPPFLQMLRSTSYQFHVLCVCARCSEVQINAPKWRVNILFSCIHCIIYFYQRCMQWFWFFEYTLKPSNLIKCHVKIYVDWNYGIESSIFEEWNAQGIDKFPLHSSYILLFFHWTSICKQLFSFVDV